VLRYRDDRNENDNDGDIDCDSRLINQRTSVARAASIHLPIADRKKEKKESGKRKNVRATREESGGYSSRFSVQSHNNNV
jgi:hypothetical protein